MEEEFFDFNSKHEFSGVQEYSMYRKSAMSAAEGNLVLGNLTASK